MSEAVVFGYFGNGSLGDETNLRELVSFIKREFPAWKITVISRTPKQTEERYQVTGVGWLDLRRIGIAFKRADLLIGGGGSLLQDRTSLASLGYYVGLLFAAKSYRLKVLLYGQGIGPVNSPIGRYLAKHALNLVEGIAVRDRLSLIALEELGVKQPRLYLTADPLLALSPISQREVERYWGTAQPARRIGCIIKADRELKDFWKQVLSSLINQADLELYLIVINQQDHRFNMELSAGNGIVLIETENWEACQKVVAGLDLLLSARLHGLVLGAIQGVACCGLSSDPKIDGLCLQMGIPFVPLSPKVDKKALFNRIMSLVEQVKQEKPVWLEQMDFWRGRAFENQAILRSYILESSEEAPGISGNSR